MVQSFFVHRTGGGHSPWVFLPSLNPIIFRVRRYIPLLLTEETVLETFWAICKKRKCVKVIKTIRQTRKEGEKKAPPDGGAWIYGNVQAGG
jgi:hypothetical protein